MADGSSFYVTTRSPRPTMTLARDVTNHGLWNPSLARDVADQDQSGRMGRFARRYGGANNPPDASSPSTATTTTTSESAPLDHHQPSPLTPSSTQNKNQNLLDKHGFGIDDLQWISGESTQSFYGIGNAKNIKGLKKPSGPASKK
ncbi:uncharacterized protein VP01_1701g4 [Puccinia sorghi]|uniref:Uncharacterized protein n=1 Tax=Puccinia sorghi TaxID=27349 RepID=A0A0L6VFQ5_9BASI|nr:uncharacterized protein VP01_1701g4 [Puccinia sorghi]